MTKLSELLTKENISKIISLAKDFGCINVRLRCLPPVDENMPMTDRQRKLLYALKDACTLVISRDPLAQSCLETALETLLTEYFHAEFVVQKEGLSISSDTINELCADINDTARIEELYEKKINEIDIRPPDDDENSIVARERMMGLVKRVLDEKKGIFIPRHIKTPDELKAQEIEFKKFMMNSLLNYRSENIVTATPPTIQDDHESKKRLADIEGTATDNVKKKTRIDADDVVDSSSVSKEKEQLIHEQSSSPTQECTPLSNGSCFSKNSNVHHTNNEHTEISPGENPTNGDIRSSNKP